MHSRENDLREHIPHTRASSSGNLFQFNRSEWSNCEAILERTFDWLISRDVQFSNFSNQFSFPGSSKNRNSTLLSLWSGFRKGRVESWPGIREEPLVLPGEGRGKKTFFSDFTYQNPSSQYLYLVSKGSGTSSLWNLYFRARFSSLSTSFAEIFRISPHLSLHPPLLAIVCSTALPLGATPLQ